MEKAKQVVSDFISRDGQHKTTIDQDHAKAVTEEHVKPHQHENVTTAVDREVHRDHHHTTVQPVLAKETLPEQHHHNALAVEHKTFDHGGAKEMQAKLDADASKYKDTTTTHQTTHSTTTAPTVAGEHVHHHVHEHIQPVIQKEVVEPHVVHTTIPIHETHQAAPIHHGTTIAKPTTLEAFKSGGGVLAGQSTRDLTDFDGCPRGVNCDEAGHGHSRSTVDKTSTVSPTTTTQTTSSNKALDTEATTAANTAANASTSTTAGTAAGLASSKSSADKKHVSMLDVGENKPSSDATKAAAAATSNQHGSMYGADKTLSKNSSVGNNYQHSSEKTSSLGKDSIPRSEATAAGSNPSGETHKLAGTAFEHGETRKPSLVDRINPFKDADGDGKKGFMH